MWAAQATRLCRLVVAGLTCLALPASFSGFARAEAPPAPRENPKRDLEAIKAATAKVGYLSLPATVSEAEDRHNAAYDDYIRPLREVAVSVAEARTLAAVDKSVNAGDFDTARLQLQELADPVQKKLGQWLLLRRGQGSIAEYRSFLREDPKWPNRWLLIEHLEKKLLDADDAPTTLAAMAEIEPETGFGVAAHALALAKTGKSAQARKMVRELWRGAKIEAKDEKQLEQLLAGLTDPADLKARSSASKTNPDKSWRKTRSRAYDALKTGAHRKAYKIIRGPKGLSVNPRKEQEFISGWVALRYLDEAKTAIGHFEAMRKDADGPLSRSKSAYWLGRAHEAAGDAIAAKSFYAEATEKQIDTFHALLARQKLSPGNPEIEIAPPASPTPAQVQAFQKLDAAKAAVIADKAGLGRDITRPFLANLGQLYDTEAEVALAAHLTRELGDTQQSLRIGKAGIARGFNLIYYAYPLHAFPTYKPLREPPEPAFMLSIARQESEFNTKIVSSAGARGILQVMPITARHVCRDYNLRCDIARLLTDESYNTKISSAYIADRMQEFGGSYVLGLAGYNAGPGRARQWIRKIGDPRDARIDEIDWIERIPFQETRKYVAKVLSNIQIYRARLGEDKPLRLMDDLQRAKPKQRAEKRFAPGSKGLRLSSGR